MNEEEHGVSPVLWHSLDVWQVLRGMGPGQEEDAITDLLACSTDFNINNWLAVFPSVGYMHIHAGVVMIDAII